MDQENILRELLERIVRIETKMDGYNNLKEKLDNAHSVAENNKEIIREIKEGQKWLWRTVGASAIGLVIAALIQIVANTTR